MHCKRRRPHVRHDWVETPTSAEVHACPGRPREHQGTLLHVAALRVLVAH